MAGFGSLAPDQGAENDLLSQPDWREQEAQAGLAAQQEAARPGGFSTLWSAIKHPSLYPMWKGLTMKHPGSEFPPEEAPPTYPPASPDLPDVGKPLVSPGPQISAGTRLGREVSGAGEELVKAAGKAIESGATAPGR